MPCVFEQSEIMFQDSSNACYSNNDTAHHFTSLIRYNAHSKNGYEAVDFNDETKRYNYIASTANSQYICVGLELSYGYGAPEYLLKVFDKDFKEIAVAFFDSNFSLVFVTCNDDYIYVILNNRTTKQKSLIRYDFLLSTKVLLHESVEANMIVNDDKSSIYVGKDYSIKIGDKKTQLFDDIGDKKIRYLAGLEISLSNNKFDIIYDRTLSSYKTNNKSNHFYKKAFLCDNKILFATYHYVKQKDCGFDYLSSYGTKICICGLKESYLYSYDLITKQLDLIQKFKPGTFLIDYDFDNVEYYYDGNLYVNNDLFGPCLKVKPYEYSNRLAHTNFHELDASIYLRPSFYCGRFYGI